MENVYPLRYRECVACNELILEKDTREHILNCRPESLRVKKICVFCHEQLPIKDYEGHIVTCDQKKHQLSDEDTDERDQTQFETPRAQTPTQMEVDHPNETSCAQNCFSKRCIFCSKDIDAVDYENHVFKCSVNPQTLTSAAPDVDVQKNEQEKKRETNKRKLAKVCPFCRNDVDPTDFEIHISNCSSEHTGATKGNEYYAQQSRDAQLSARSSLSINSASRAGTFNGKQNPWSDRTGSTGEASTTYNSLDRRTSETVYQSSGRLQSTDDNQIEKTSKGDVERQKKCIICSQLIDEGELEEHVLKCLSQQSNHASASRSCHPEKRTIEKHCEICSKSIDERDFTDHMTMCCPAKSNQNRSLSEYSLLPVITTVLPQKDKSHSGSSLTLVTPTRRDCFICFKSIDSSQFETHVLSCAAQTDKQMKDLPNELNPECFSCKRRVKKDDESSREIACHHTHVYCLRCLQRSMEEFARQNQTPVCHKDYCDYQLSRHDICSIPLERRICDRLLQLAKGQQRPFCSKCGFYIDSSDNFDEHVESCDDLIPCEYCDLPYSFNKLEDHARQCQQDKTSQREKLAHFILTRTKYPFTMNQIHLFIKEKSKDARPDLDPRSLIQALAVFGTIFPYELPTRVCDICTESRPYDDIYVFDCGDSHKLCYECYHQSCQSKMSSGEVLTCPLCQHVLKDGELNQLRISNDELKTIRDYQIRKTFDIYSNATRGIIKCPSEKCSWVAQADDPNERFRVVCPLCQNEFCSLCNQQYHYRTVCQQLPQITQRWFFWCQTERNRYLRMRAQQDSTFAAQLSEYNRQTTENENRNRDLRRRYEDLLRDEQYKAQNCRLCPSCKRVIQRLEGCDSMVCGQDAHGGNIQSGCGAKFSWPQAKPYQASTTDQPRQVILDLPKPESAVVRHNGVKCDHCQNYVNGIRFDCVHCPSLTFCEKCEQQATLDHSRHARTTTQQHIFKLIMTPDEEAFR